MKDNAFVFVTCGEQHATRLRTTLRFLRHFSQAPVVVVSTSDLGVSCDEHIVVKVPPHLDNHQASIFIKTSLHRTLANKFSKLCYLDNDVIAVNSEVDNIFELGNRPICFARDHCTLSEFGRYAVECRCEGSCEHLQNAIHKKFNIQIEQAAWRHWNGGVFVFDAESFDFMELWHRYMVSIFIDSYWKTRDQGALAATVWKLGLQSHPTLPQKFNFIVDPFVFDLTPFSKRGTVKASDLGTNTSYSLHADEASLSRPSFLHFINGGVGKKGWKNWDDVELLLSESS